MFGDFVARKVGRVATLVACYSRMVLLLIFECCIVRRFQAFFARVAPLHVQIQGYIRKRTTGEGASLTPMHVTSVRVSSWS